MSDETKRFMLDSVRKSFGEFMQEVIKIPGSPGQKQQAYLRFEEAHMWLQNSIVNYVEVEAPKQPDLATATASAANEEQPAVEPQA